VLAATPGGELVHLQARGEQSTTCQKFQIRPLTTLRYLSNITGRFKFLFLRYTAKKVLKSQEKLANETMMNQQQEEEK
jgi:hypothetical protein